MKTSFIQFPLVLGLFWLGIGAMNAQHLQKSPTALIPNSYDFETVNAIIDQERTLSTKDILYYAQSKATAFRAVELSSLHSASEISQFFSCPQQISLSAFDFYAWATEPVELLASVYYASDDFLPTGTALAKTNVSLRAYSASSNLNSLKTTASFPQALVLDRPYVIVLSIPNDCFATVSVMASDFENGDGLFEYFGAAYVSPGAESLHKAKGWKRGYELFFEDLSTHFDADWLIEPHVEYQTWAQVSLERNGCKWNVEAELSPIFYDRMYNVDALLAYFVKRSSPQNVSWMLDHQLLVPGNKAFSLEANSLSKTLELQAEMRGWKSQSMAVVKKELQDDVSTSVSYEQKGARISFSAQVAEAQNWSWDFGDGQVSNEQNPEHSYTEAGLYTVQYQFETPCGDQRKGTKLVHVDASELSHETLASLAIVTYPNPAVEQVNVQFGDLSGKVTKLSLVNVQGAVFFEQSQNQEDNKANFNVSMLPEGLYFIKLEAEGKVYVQKLVVNK